MKNRPHFTHLLGMCADFPPLRTAIICPHEQAALEGPLLARDKGLIEPVLVGNPADIREAAARNDLDIAELDIVEADGENGAAHRGVDLVAEGKAAALMKGHIHSDTYLAAIIRKENGLRTSERTTHCFVMDIPNWPKPVIITDAALNIAPDMKIKRSIARNAIALAHALGIDEPKVAILSAVESPNENIPSSVEARRIAEELSATDGLNALVDGPFALDNAVNEEAAQLKGITSPVAGNADILLVPTIEAGNIFYKALTFMAGAEAAGLVVGAKTPVILTSRADSIDARLASCALAVLYAQHLGAPSASV